VPLKHNLRQTYLLLSTLYYELPSATNVACVHPIRLKGARAAGYAIRQILCCGIVKASSSSKTAENINYISQAKIPSSKIYGEYVTKNIGELILPMEVRTCIHSLSKNIIPENNIFSASVAFLLGYIYS
jgi:hypothetical protein